MNAVTSAGFAWTVWFLACLISAADQGHAEQIALSGSPLYTFTVHESIQGLKSSGQEKTAEQGKVCPNCGKVHPVAAVVGTNHVAAIPSPEMAQQEQPCPVCGQIHRVQQPGQTNVAAAALLPAVNSSQLLLGKYYFCTKCKIYHQGKPSTSVVGLPSSDVLAWPTNVQPRTP